MGKVIIHDASYTVGPTSATIAKFSNEFTVVLQDQNGQGKRTKTVKVRGFKLDERDALREAEARNPGWGVKTITLDAQSAEQEMGELGKQMKKMKNKDAGPGPVSAATKQARIRDLMNKIQQMRKEGGNKEAEELRQELKRVRDWPTKDCAGTKDCGCGCTKDEMFTPYDSELKKHAAGAKARKVQAVAEKPKGKNIHIWLE